MYKETSQVTSPKIMCYFQSSWMVNNILGRVKGDSLCSTGMGRDSLIPYSCIHCKAPVGLPENQLEIWEKTFRVVKKILPTSVSGRTYIHFNAARYLLTCTLLLHWTSDIFKQMWRCIKFSSTSNNLDTYGAFTGKKAHWHITMQNLTLISHIIGRW